MFIVRNTSNDFVYASVIEPHGYFDESSESSLNAYGVIEKIEVVGYNDQATVIEVLGKNNLKWKIIINNVESKKGKHNKVRIENKVYQWVGDYSVKLIDK